MSHVLWALVAVYAIHRVTHVAELFAPSPASTPAEVPLVEVPDDLMAIALQERESWAQEEVMRVIRERYEDLRDWNKVRSAMGVGRIDN